MSLDPSKKRTKKFDLTTYYDTSGRHIFVCLLKTDYKDKDRVICSYLSTYNNCTSQLGIPEFFRLTLVLFWAIKTRSVYIITKCCINIVNFMVQNIWWIIARKIKRLEILNSIFLIQKSIRVISDSVRGKEAQG